MVNVMCVFFVFLEFYKNKSKKMEGHIFYKTNKFA